MKISATIITCNEERNIARAMESLRCCDEIVVIDSGSIDRTGDIAAKLGARVLESPWPGYARQKNLAAERASHDWILSIDADEALSEALEGEIWRIKKNGPQYDAYTMPRLAQYLGRWILHSGWYPDRKVRLYDRRRARWVGEFVHEAVQVDGRIGHLQSDLLHFTCSSLSEHLKTMDRYTTLAAEQLVAQGTRIGWSKLLFDPAFTFCRSFVFRRGYLDGAEGLTIAYMAALYNFVKFMKALNMSSRR
ncbi:MAG TPA: glycosyltransferase family 2 protein [Bryobacteraceae bacterium]|nr:glycosyltransferase family 2 protein [Bryobacteraceae bacterium]